jgi:ABC-type lipoprotein release transport system permease subunit
MTTDWNEARLDRLTERIDRIESQRWEEKQRAFERQTQIYSVILWLMVVAIWGVALAAAIADSN